MLILNADIFPESCPVSELEDSTWKLEARYVDQSKFKHEPAQGLSSLILNRCPVQGGLLSSDQKM